MDVVIVRTGLAHGFEAPVRGSRSQQLGMLLIEVAEGGIRRFAAE
jgi:hypothetical protein